MKSLTNYTRIVILSVAAMLMATPALSQQTPEERSESAMNRMEQPHYGPADEAIKDDYSDDMSGTTVALGEAVWSSDGEELGEVTKVNLDANGQVESIHFVVGALLGIGGKTVMSEGANFSQNNNRIELKINAEAAKALPAIKA